MAIDVSVPSIASVTPIAGDSVLGVQGGLVKRFPVIALVAAAGTLDGTTLASNVVNASLNAVTPTGGTLNVAGALASTGYLTSGIGGSTNIATHITLNATDSAANGGAVIGLRNGTQAWFFGDVAAALGSGTGLMAYVNGDNPSITYINGSERTRVSSTGLDITGATVTTTGFGCNGKTAQTAYASGGAATDAATTQTLANNIRSALIANGIMS